MWETKQGINSGEPEIRCSWFLWSFTSLFQTVNFFLLLYFHFCQHIWYRHFYSGSVLHSHYMLVEVGAKTKSEIMSEIKCFLCQERKFLKNYVMQSYVACTYVGMYHTC